MSELLTPASLVGRPDEAIRARCWLIACLFAAPMTAVFGAVRFASGAPVLGMLDWIGSLGFIGAGVYLSRTGDIARSVHAAGALAVLLLVQAALFGGGLTGPAVAWYGALPIAALLGLGRERGLAWAALALPLPFLLLIASRIGLLPAGEIADEGQALLHGMLVGALAGLTWTYEGVSEHAREERDVALAELEAERRKTADLSTSRQQFIRNVSHEVRTPLNHMLGVTQLLSQGPLDDEQRILVGIAEDSGSELLRMVDGAIAAEEAEGTVQIAEAPMDLRMLFERVARVFGPRVAAAGLEFVIEDDPTLPTRALGDPHRVEQVLTALLENALAFTKEGRIQLRARALGRGRIRFEVEDTGVGVSPDQFDRIFEPFRQGDESDGRKKGGFGVGLAVCRRLARHMGGDVTVTSVRGAGSTFAFDLRVGAARTGPTTGSTDLEARARPVRALLAERNPRVRDGFLSILSHVGVVARGVADQAELERACREESFDLILVDYGLPGLRVDLRRDRTATWVALTPPVRGAAPRAPPEGFDDHLPKPLRREQVLEVLKRRAQRVSG